MIVVKSRVRPGMHLGYSFVWIVIASILSAFDTAVFRKVYGFDVMLELELRFGLPLFDEGLFRLHILRHSVIRGVVPPQNPPVYSDRQFTIFVSLQSILNAKQPNLTTPPRAHSATGWMDHRVEMWSRYARSGAEKRRAVKQR